MNELEDDERDPGIPGNSNDDAGNVSIEGNFDVSKTDR